MTNDKFSASAESKIVFYDVGLWITKKGATRFVHICLVGYDLDYKIS